MAKFSSWVNWNDNYFIDADHINLDTVDRFIEPSDFFTIDVAGYINDFIVGVDLTLLESKIKFIIV